MAEVNADLISKAIIYLVGSDIDSLCSESIDISRRYK